MKPDVEQRLADLEHRVTALEGSPTPPPGESDLWLLGQLSSRSDTRAGSVIFAGDVVVGDGRAQYQWHRPTEMLLDAPWDEHLLRLAALAHPARGVLLRRLLTSPATAAELVEEELVSSTGTAYHHLGALQSGGWITKGPGGHWSIRTSRVVPLLTIIAATEDH